MSAARDVYWNVKEKNQPQNQSSGIEMQINHFKNLLGDIQVKYLIIITFNIQCMALQNVQLDSMYPVHTDSGVGSYSVG